MTQSLSSAGPGARAKHLARRDDFLAMLERAEEAAERRFEVGESEQNALLELVAKTVIRDRLALPTDARFEMGDDSGGNPQLVLRYRKKSKWEDQAYSIHRHALGQLAAKAEIPVAYVNRLNARNKSLEWRTELLTKNFNDLFHKTEWGNDRLGRPMQYLHRVVGTELRGFLSRIYNRHLASAPLLRAFVETTREMTARPIEAVASDVRYSLKCYLPHVFEAYPGQYLCLGVEWTNSDFGAGRHMVSQCLWDPLRDTGAVLDEGISKVHIGAIIEDSDLELSPETLAKEVETQVSAIHDAVADMLSEKSLQRVRQAVRIAAEHEVSWSKLKGQLANYLYKTDLETIERLLAGDEGVVDLPPPGYTSEGRPIPTKWWAATLVSTMAARTKDEDRKMDLQHAAGEFLSGLVKKEKDGT
jgi:hypothetical protein